MWTAPLHTSPYKGQSEASSSPSTFLICLLGYTSGFPILVLIKASVEAGWSCHMIVFPSMKKKSKHLLSRMSVDGTDSICAACGPVTPQASWLSHSWFRLLLANRNGRLLRVWLLWLCRFLEQAAYFASDIFAGVFPDEAQQLVFCREPQRSSPAILWVTSDKKKIPIVNNNRREGKPISEPVAFSDHSFTSLFPDFSLHYYPQIGLCYLLHHISWESP